MTETPRSRTLVVLSRLPGSKQRGPQRPRPPTPREEWRCYTCGQKGHLARHCPGAGDVSMPTASPSDQRGGACLRTTCWSHKMTVSPSLPVRVARRDTHALLDSGSMVTLIQPGLADGTLGHEVEVGCIHGQTETYPTNRITVQTQKGTFTVQAGVVLYLPMPLLIGRDCPIFGRSRAPDTPTPTSLGKTMPVA